MGKQKTDFVFSFLTKEFSDAILKLDLIWKKNRGMNMIRNILEYLEKTGIEMIYKRERELMHLFLEKIQGIPGLTLYGT